MEEQIVSKERVEKFGEVYTGAKEVNAMCDEVKDTINNINATIMEPSFGKGAFLLEVLRRRKSICKSNDELNIALSNIYGVEILKDNVDYTREKMLEIVKDLPNAKEIIEHNLVWGNFLTNQDLEHGSNIRWL